MSQPIAPPNSVHWQALDVKSKRKNRQASRERGIKQAIKRGRPPKVTKSEKRKLARLYMYTTLSVPQIRSILRKYTGKHISNRACQNHLQAVLHTELKSTRPRDRQIGQGRMQHLKRFQALELAKGKENTKLKIPSLVHGSHDSGISTLPFESLARRSFSRNQKKDRNDEGSTSGSSAPGLATSQTSEVLEYNVKSPSEACRSNDNQLPVPLNHKSGVSELHHLYVAFPDVQAVEAAGDRRPSISSQGPLSLLSGVDVDNFVSDVSREIMETGSHYDTDLVFNFDTDHWDRVDQSVPTVDAGFAPIPPNDTEFLPSFEENHPVPLPDEDGNTNDFLEWNHLSERPVFPKACVKAIDIGIADVAAGSSLHTYRPSSAFANDQTNEDTTICIPNFCPTQCDLASGAETGHEYMEIDSDPWMGAMVHPGFFDLNGHTHDKSLLPLDERRLADAARLYTGALERDTPDSLHKNDASGAKSLTAFSPKRTISRTASVTSGASRRRQKLDPKATLQDQCWERIQTPSCVSDDRGWLSTSSLEYFSSSLKYEVNMIFKNASLTSVTTRSTKTPLSIRDCASRASCFQPMCLNDLYHPEPSINLLNVSNNQGNKEKMELSGQINARDRFNNTLLHKAAAGNANYEEFIKLIERGAPLDATNTSGQNFMHVIVPVAVILSGKLPDLLQGLLKLSFDFSRQDQRGSNSLRVLLQYILTLGAADIDKLFEILRPHISALFCRDSLGRSVTSELLYLADAYPNNLTFQELCHGILRTYCEVDPISCDATALLAFHQAPSADTKEEQDALEAIVCHSVTSPSSEDVYGRNGLHCLLQHPILMPRPASPMTPAQSCRASIPTFNELLCAGVSPTNYDKTGKTPLIVLVHYHDDSSTAAECLTGLIKMGANVNNRDRQGETSLHIAVKRGLITETRLIIDNGANLNARQKDGKGVIRLGLDAASRKRSYKSLSIRILYCIDLVREHGGKENPTDFDEWDAGN